MREIKYIELLRVLIAIRQSPTVAFGEARATCVPLFEKFLRHVSSVHDLASGAKIPELDLLVLDPGAVNIIARAAFESCIKFHYQYLGNLWFCCFRYFQI